MTIQLHPQTGMIKKKKSEKNEFTMNVYRIEIKNLGGGKHQLIFNKLELKDAGTITCKSNELTSICLLEVKKGEEKPVIMFDENVEGPISRPISFEVPYKGNAIFNKIMCKSILYYYKTFFVVSKWNTTISY